MVMSYMKELPRYDRTLVRFVRMERTQESDRKRPLPVFVKRQLYKLGADVQLNLEIVTTLDTSGNMFRHLVDRPHDIPLSREL